MNQKDINRQRGGIIMNVLIAVAVLVAIKVYFNFDVIAWIKTPAGQKILVPVWNFLKLMYTTVKGWVS
jgi:hypothetical protein